MDKVGILGAGSLGTALAQIVAQNVENVFLLSRREEQRETINSTHINSEYYPNVKLEENIIATTDYNDLKDCGIIFLSVPSSAFRSTLSTLKNYVDSDAILVTTAKGIEYPSLKTMGRLIEEYFDEDYVALSGPNFASEIVLNLSTPKFKLKIIDDVDGLEICGIIKNINAIANGICEGMNIHENARYGILTKGFEETKKIVESIGGDASTAEEYCGFGDLVLTSTSSESRNHTLGMLYGQRIIVDEKASGIVFEGKNSIMAIKDICRNTNTESVIVDFVYDVIVKQIPPKIAFKSLWDNILN